jgi:hypothetical protein
MSSLCLLSVDDVYEQDGLAAECLMVHKIKPRLSAAQRLPSGSHVVEACWEYKFRAHGQVNAPPLSPRVPPPHTPSSGSRQAHPGRAGDASTACNSQIPKPRCLVEAAWPWGHHRPLPHLGRGNRTGCPQLWPCLESSLWWRPSRPSHSFLAGSVLGP